MLLYLADGSAYDGLVILIEKEAPMATAKPTRKKAATVPTTSAQTKGHKPAHATTSGRTRGSEISSKRQKTGERVQTSQSAQLVADVRSGLGVTRELFARLTGFSVRAIRGRRKTS